MLERLATGLRLVAGRFVQLQSATGDSLRPATSCCRQLVTSCSRQPVASCSRQLVTSCSLRPATSCFRQLVTSCSRQPVTSCSLRPVTSCSCQLVTSCSRQPATSRYTHRLAHSAWLEAAARRLPNGEVSAPAGPAVSNASCDAAAAATPASGAPCLPNSAAARRSSCRFAAPSGGAPAPLSGAPPPPSSPGRAARALSQLAAGRWARDARLTGDGLRATMEQIVSHENIYTVPNLLSVGRIVATPLIGWLVVCQLYTPALIGFVVAGATDLLDGWIARRFPSQASRLGSFLDPLADKLLTSTLFLSLTYSQLIPLSLTLLIVTRDVGLIAAASWVRFKSVPPPVTLSRYFDATLATAQLEPLYISKVNTCLQLALVASTLASPVFGFSGHSALRVLWCLTAGTTVASGMVYVLLRNTTFKLMRHQHR